MTNMCGVWRASYARPTSPVSSSRTGWVSPYLCVPATLASTPYPCLPGAPELIAIHTMPLSVYLAARPLSEPFVCDARTKGHSGLNHSRTTVLPRNWLSFTLCPSRSDSSNSGAGFPTRAEPIAAPSVFAPEVARDSDAELARLHAVRRRAPNAVTTMHVQGVRRMMRASYHGPAAGNPPRARVAYPSPLSTPPPCTP